MKICRKCQQAKAKTLDNFPLKIQSKDGLDSWCRKCRNQQAKEWKANNKEKNKAAMKSWAARNPHKVKNIILKKNYGITLEDFNKLLEKQNNGCAVCKSIEKLCVDHCHETGKVRGLLCSACNKAAGFLKNDPGLCLRLHFYLNQFEESSD